MKATQRACWTPRWVWLLSLGLLAGCSVPIAANLGEHEANQAIVALDRAGLFAAKEPDPNAEGRWRLTVPEGDTSAAVSVLREEDLPPRPTPGVLEAMGKGSLVPSRALEHAKWLAGVAGELEATLSAIDGVVSARVHLALGAPNALELGSEAQAPSASVLLRHRGANLPIAPGDVQRLIAGAVPGLLPDAVSVVSATVPPRAKRIDRALAQLGPITLTKASLIPLKLVFGVALTLNLVLLGLVAWLWSRGRRVRERLTALEDGGTAGGP